MKKWLILISMLLVIFILSGCGCDHEWIEANCVQAKTCALCEKIDGEPLGHSWTDATCTTAQTCTRCAATEGAPLPHTLGEEVVSIEYLQGLQSITQNCTVCGAELSRSSNPISLIEDGLFVLNPRAFIVRLNFVYQEMGLSDMEAGILEDDSDALKAIIFKGGVEYASIIFNTPNQDPNSGEPIMQMKPDQASEPLICQVATLIHFLDIAKQQSSSESFSSKEETDEYLVSAMIELQENRDALFRDIIVPILKACDPALTDAEIEEILTVFNENTLICEDTCGQLSIQHINGFLIMLSHIFLISTSSDYFAMPGI